MCDCGGELTDWCFDCSDWVCDECGCPSSFDHDPFFNDEDDETAPERFYEDFYAALKTSNDRRGAESPPPCAICDSSERHGLHIMRRNGSIEGLPMVGDAPTVPFCDRCGHHAEQHDQYRRCRACACSDFTDGAA